MDERFHDWRRVTDRQLDDLELKYEALDGILRGHPEDNEDGLIAEVHSIDTKVNDVRAELFRIKQLVSDEIHERREDRRISWGNLTKIIVAIITSGTIGLFWRDIRAYIEKYQKPDALEQMIEKAKHPKARRHHFTPKPRPSEPEAEAEPEN